MFVIEKLFHLFLVTKLLQLSVFVLCFSLSTKEDLHKSTVISFYQTERDEIGLRVALRLFQSFIQKYTLPFKSRVSVIFQLFVI